MAFFRFQDLPRRVRETIYEELFVKPKSVNISEVVRKSKPTVTNLKSPSGLSLLRANKQIHRECLQVLYGRNTFILEAPGLKPERIKIMKKFLKIVGIRGRRELKYLALHSNHYRLRGRLSNRARLATVAELCKCLSYLEDSWLKVLELSLDDKLFADIENSLGVLKADELAIRASPPFIPPPELLKMLWASKIVTLGSVVTCKDRPSEDPDTLCQKQVYRSVFADETIEIDMEYTPLAADCKDHFSALPYEIRELILEHLLIATTDIHALEIYPHAYCGSILRIQSRKRNFRNQITIGLLRTSRLLHQESSTLLYGQNIFALDAYEENAITDWLRTIGPVNRKRLRFLRLDHDVLLRGCEMDLPIPMSIPTVSANRSSMGSRLGKKVVDTFHNPVKAVTEHINEVTGMIAKDYTSTLELLEGIPHLSRLELHVPYHYGFRYDDFLDFDEEGPMSHLEANIPCPALVQQTIDSLQKIHVSNELRLAIDSLTVNLASALESMGLARLVLFNVNILDWMEPEDYDVHIDQELLGVNSDWHYKSGPGELMRTFRSFPHNKLENRISELWPGPSELWKEMCSLSCMVHDI